ncbi:uncharacterized protein BXIN_1151 [Babesia sp. Xinjiang]|uniref:uncharacterized protein n=1 Tax=Babesia sp. Xinjiang TaxID=462227 RepID=UPI000A229CE7|nr:uncharacterized protein BXIN_1151 [Babesia sp. Xinjiang]ORM40140.1 hypothetical protein BXIN_1151 [Babesia sp. Xinjiang]
MNVFGIIAVLTTLTIRHVASTCLTFVPVDISVEKSQAYTRHNESENSYSISVFYGKCIGNVLNGMTVISYTPEGDVSSRNVMVHRFEKRDVAPGSIEPAVDESGQFEVIEIETVHNEIPMRQRLVLSKDGTYSDFQYAFVELDICGDSFDDFTHEVAQTQTSATAELLRPKSYQRIGTVKCGDRVLLEADDAIFTRYAMRNNNAWEIITTPYVGRKFQTTFLPVAWDDCSYRIADPGSTYVDLSLDYEAEYGDVLVDCGENCIFFDGCTNPERRVVDVLDRNGVIYMGVNTRCINLKLQTFGQDKYLTIFAKLINGMFEAKRLVSTNGRTYVPYKPQIINLELTDDHVDEHINVAVEGNTKTYTIPTPDNLKYSIGAVTYNKHVLAGRAFIDTPDNVPYIVLSRKVTVNDGMTTIYTEKDNAEPTVFTYVTSKDMVTLYTPKSLDFDLAEIHKNNSAFKVTRVEDDRYHVITKDPHMKIGTVKYKNQVVHRNQYGVVSSQLIYRFGELSVISELSESQVFYNRYIMTKGFVADDIVMFVEQYKDPVTLHLELLYTGNLPQYFCVEPFGAFVKVYLCKHLFGHTLGSVMFNKGTVVPHNRYYKTREVYVSWDFFLSSLVVKSYTENGDVVVESFNHRIKDRGIHFAQHTKKAVTVDLSPKVNLDRAVTRLQDGNVYHYSIKTEYAKEYRIGDIKNQGIHVTSDNALNISRSVTVTVDRHANPSKSVTLRIADITLSGPRARLLTGDTDLHLTYEAPKKPLTVDVTFRGKRDEPVSIGYSHDTISFYVPWTHACEYKLAKVVATDANKKVSVLFGELGLQEMPEVRLRKVGEESKALISITPKVGKPVYGDVKCDANGSISVSKIESNNSDVMYTSHYGEL